jgi:hypothetical protein
MLHHTIEQTPESLLCQKRSATNSNSVCILLGVCVFATFRLTFDGRLVGVQYPGIGMAFVPVFPVGFAHIVRAFSPLERVTRIVSSRFFTRSGGVKILES